MRDTELCMTPTTPPYQFQAPAK